MDPTDQLATTSMFKALGLSDLSDETFAQIANHSAGRTLLTWLTSQIDQNVSSESQTESGGRESAMFRETLRDISLETEEVQIAKTIAGSLPTSTGPGEGLSPVGNYLPPSYLKKRAEYADEESKMLQEEIEQLRARLSQIKVASRHLSQSLNSIQNAINEVKSKTRLTEERLLDLSFQVDTNVASTLESAHNLIQDLGGTTVVQPNAETSAHEDPDIHSARSILRSTQDSLSQIVTSLKGRTLGLSQLRQLGAHKLQDIESEAARLNTAFKSLPRSLDERDLEESYLKELEHICSLLENQGNPSSEGIDDWLQLLENRVEAQHYTALNELDAAEELQYAWRLDQIAILDLHDDILRKTSSSLDEILAPLEGLYHALSSLARCVKEAEALLEAFGEELEEIDFEQPSKTESHSSYSESTLETGLKTLLHRFKDVRPAAASPLVLLSQDDILLELSVLREQQAAMENLEKSWAEDLIRAYSTRPTHPTIPHLYANSPVNTSLPFAFSPDLQQLEVQANERAKELQDFAISLEKEVPEIFAKESKRLGAFVDRWCSGNE